MWTLNPLHHLGVRYGLISETGKDSYKFTHLRCSYALRTRAYRPDGSFISATVLNRSKVEAWLEFIVTFRWRSTAIAKEG